MPNAAGVKYYKDLISEVIAAGIIPIVTLYHWDLPQALEDKGGWLNEDIVDYFGNYSRICFQEFGASGVNHYNCFYLYILSKNHNVSMHIPEKLPVFIIEQNECINENVLLFNT